MIRVPPSLFLITLVILTIGLIGALFNEWRFALAAVLWLLMVLFAAIVDPYP